MNSLILQSASRLLIPLQFVFSLFLLFRGHNEPGGGFAAGLVASAALALHSIAYSPEATRRLIRLEPVSIVALGLILALLSGALGLLEGSEFLTGQWLEIPGLRWEVGTPLVFDAGVYLLVIGVGASVLLNLMERR